MSSNESEDDMKSKTKNNFASTSNDTSMKKTELKNTRSNTEINKCNKIFKELIAKCYENTNFPNSGIKVVDNLFKSMPPEFVYPKCFIALLEEVNSKIWPDCNISLYEHIENISNKLKKFKMEVQDSKLSIENEEDNRKKLIKLNKLKAALKKIRKKIKSLDETEMDINDDNNYDYDSAYILKDKYEKRALKVYKRMCMLRKEPDYLETPPLRFNQTKNSLVNKTIEKYYNIKKIFPSYFEIYTLLKVLNKKKKLNWTETKLKHISQDTFHKLGKQLKIQRLSEYFGRLADVTTDKDPAEDNEELKTKLFKSNQKFCKDLDAITIKFLEEQKYAEETEGSNLSNTDCENSSEDNCNNTNKTYNMEFNNSSATSVKRKKELLDDPENDLLSKKSKKTIYMESFNLTPCVVASEDLNCINEISCDNDKDIFDLTSKENIDNVSLKKISDNTIDVTNEPSNSVKQNIANNDENKNSSINTIVKENSCIENNTNKTISKISQENNIQVVKGLTPLTNDQNDCTVNIQSEDNEPLIIEPEVVVHEGKSPVHNVIEINELDDSDVEITACDTPKVPIQNKKSLESIIKTMNFDKKYNWYMPTQTPNPNNLNRIPSHTMPHQQFNSNSSLVNYWVVNNVRPSRPNNMQIRHSNQRQNNRSSVGSHRMQSTFQTARQVTQRVSNSVQQQRNFTNQSLLSQHVTTMTTTTTVRQIVQQQSSVPVPRRLESIRDQVNRPMSLQQNNNDKPELIELD